MKPKLESQILAASLASNMVFGNPGQSAYTLDAVPRIPDPFYTFGEQNPRGRYLGEQNPRGYRKKVEKKKAKKKRTEKLHRMERKRRKA